MSDIPPNSEPNLIASSGSQLIGASATVFEPLQGILNGASLGNAFVQFLSLSAVFIARVIVTPCEFMLRWRFGERYFSVAVILSTVLFGCFLATFGDVPFRLGVLLILATCIGSAYNRYKCFTRDRKGDYWHSYSDGDSFLRFPKGEQWLAKYFFNIDLSKLIIEPLVLVLVAGLFFLINIGSDYYSSERYFYGNIFGFYFLFAGVLTFLYHYYAGQLRKAATLDQKDAQIMLMVESEALKTEPSEPRKLMRVKGVAFIPPSTAKAVEKSEIPKQDPEEGDDPAPLPTPA